MSDGEPLHLSIRPHVPYASSTPAEDGFEIRIAPGYADEFEQLMDDAGIAHGSQTRFATGSSAVAFMIGSFLTSGGLKP